MMDAFRKFGATKTSKVMLTVLVVSFAAWGIGGYLTHSIGGEALKVNGEPISPSTVEQTFNQRMENISQLLGAKPTKEQIDQMQLPEQIVTEVVARTVLRQTAEAMQFQPSTKQLQDEIKMVSAFKNEKGQFDPARYHQILQQINRSPAQFEHDLGQDIIVRQLARLSRVEMPSQNLAALIAAADNTHLTLDVATFEPSTITGLPAPTEAELQAFYASNTQVYSKPETRDLVVLRLSKEDMMKTITVSDKDVMAAYEANKKAYTLPEQRTVRHILVSSKEAAEKLIPTIKSLDDFAKAANADSQDPGNNGKGGLLGSIQQKDVVPAFGKVAFSLPENTLSQPVQSNFGWHLIWVEKIEPAKALAYDEVKDAIQKDLEASQASDAIDRLSAQVDEKVAGGESLSKIATELGLKPVQHNMVTAKDEGVDPQELEAAFALQKDEISVPIPVKDGGNTYVQVTEINPAKVQPLAEVKDRVTKDWQNARIQIALQKNAGAVLGVIRQPGNKLNLTEALAKAGVPGKIETLKITSADEAPAWMQRQLLDIYPMALGTALPAILKDGENWHVLRLADREQIQPTAEALPENAKIYQQRLQGDVETLLMNYLTQNARVTLNQSNLKQIFGREVVWDTPATN